MICSYRHFITGGLLILGVLAAWPASAAPSLEQLANMAYTGIFERAVTLKNGRWEGKPFVAGGSARPAVGLVEDFLLTGDLDNDGSDEAIVLLWERSGGSGSYEYVAVVGLRDGKPLNLGTALIGDRIQVRDGRIVGNRIELNVVEPGPNDASCCPSQKVLRTWTLNATGLHVNAPRITGTLSLADLAGTGWVLSRLRSDAPPMAQPEITLVFDGDRISGRSACNRYFARVTQGGKRPGDLRVSQIGTTRMACPEEIMARETRYLEALAAVTRFGFVAGKLALTWQADGATRTMLFNPRPPRKPQPGKGPRRRGVTLTPG
jgi:heat shock protein HslJ